MPQTYAGITDVVCMHVQQTTLAVCKRATACNPQQYLGAVKHTHGKQTC
jgi:hypothetical protein